MDILNRPKEAQNGGQLWELNPGPLALEYPKRESLCNMLACEYIELLGKFTYCY